MNAAVTPLPPCDCLTWCGDDPDVAAGRAEPCSGRRAQLRQAVADLLLRQLGFDDTLQALQELQRLQSINPAPPRHRPCRLTRMYDEATNGRNEGSPQ